MAASHQKKQVTDLHFTSQWSVLALCRLIQSWLSTLPKKAYLKLCSFISLEQSNALIQLTRTKPETEDFKNIYSWFLELKDSKITKQSNRIYFLKSLFICVINNDSPGVMQLIRTTVLFLQCKYLKYSPVLLEFCSFGCWHWSELFTSQRYIKCCFRLSSGIPVSKTFQFHLRYSFFFKILRRTSFFKIYLAVLGLSFSSYGTQDLVPWPGMESWPPALEGTES